MRLFKQKDGYLSPTNIASLQHFQKLNIHDTKSRLIDIDIPRENTPTKEKIEKPIKRAKSAHVITKATKTEETTIAKKKVSSTPRPRSNRSHLSVEEHDSSVQRKSKSANGLRSPRSKSKGPKKLTKDEKERKKERSADIKKLKYFFIPSIVTFFFYTHGSSIFPRLYCTVLTKFNQAQYFDN